MVMVQVSDTNIQYLEDKINEIEINGKNKNIIDSYKGIKELKEGYQPSTGLVKIRRAICVQIPTLF